MYQVLTNLTIQQITPYIDASGAAHTRNLLLTVPWLHSYRGHSSWGDQCDTMNIELSKSVKVFYTDSNNVKVSLGSSNTSLGNYTDDNTLINGVPTFMQGDMVTLNVGYNAKVAANGASEVVYMTGANDPTGAYTSGTSIPPLFQGFIAKVTPTYVKRTKTKSADSMFTLECEDAMWLLKQMPTGQPVQWQGTNIPTIVSQLLTAAYDTELYSRYDPYLPQLISVSDYSLGNLVFDLADVWTTGGSIGDFLAQMKAQYQFYSYFRGYELRIGLLTYVPGDAVTQTFTFTQNILDGDNIEFRRVDDNVMSIDVKSTYAIAKDGAPTTTDGQTVMTKASKEVLVYINNSGMYDSQVKDPDTVFPVDDTGTRLSYPIYGISNATDGSIDITDPQQLTNIGIALLKKRYYKGLNGSFTTFGVPYVKHGDVIQLVHPILPEMNGMYLCRAVAYFGGAEQGLRQTITLDFKINTYNDITALS